jgi:hypothetical protein
MMAKARQPGTDDATRLGVAQGSAASAAGVVRFRCERFCCARLGRGSVNHLGSDVDCARGCAGIVSLDGAGRIVTVRTRFGSVSGSVDGVGAG